MARVALVNLRFCALGMTGDAGDYAVELEFQAKHSLGLAYLAGALVEAGHEPVVIDAQAERLTTAEVLERVEQVDPDVIGVSLYQETMPELIEFLRMLGARPQAHVTCGGQYATFEAERILASYPRVDSVVLGEGELTLVELVNTLPAPEWLDVPGLCVRRAGAPTRTKRRSLIADLDTLPIPQRSYLRGPIAPDTEVIISASRGCWAKCEFCSIRTFYGQQQGRSIRIRTPDRVVDEIEHLNREYGVRQFFFADDDFMVTNLIRGVQLRRGKVSSNWTDRFAAELARRELDISFDIDCRVDEIDRGTFQTLRAAGLRGVFMGIESFVQRQLDFMRKDVSVEQNFAAIKLLHELRITVWMGFIMFDPFTTLAEVRENVAGLDRIHYFRYFNYDRPLSSDFVASQLTAYPGTPTVATLRRMCPEHLERTEHGWSWRFVHDETARFHRALSRWRPVVNEMIDMDTLRTIRAANARADRAQARELNALSRRYMALDRETFIGLLDRVEQGREDEIDDYIEEQRGRWAGLERQIERARDSSSKTAMDMVQSR
ncbi:MAG: radical SAM protein [Enhygromyxa sp.]